MPPAHALLSSPQHRLPTLWSLFRPLLRAARTAPLDHLHRDALQAHVRTEFRSGRTLGSVDRARRKLGEAEQVRPLSLSRSGSPPPPLTPTH